MPPIPDGSTELQHLIFHMGNETLVLIVLILALACALAPLVVDGFKYLAAQETERKKRESRGKGRKSPYNDDDEPPPTFGIM